MGNGGLKDPRFLSRAEARMQNRCESTDSAAVGGVESIGLSPASLVTPIRLMMASSAPVGWAFSAMAAWTAHLAGTGIILTAISGLAGWQREWIAAAVAPAAIAACLAATPVLLADEALHFAQETVSADVLAREPVHPARE
jgi:hypothetical protein